MYTHVSILFIFLQPLHNIASHLSYSNHTKRKKNLILIKNLLFVVVVLAINIVIVFFRGRRTIKAGGHSVIRNRV